MSALRKGAAGRGSSMLKTPLADSQRLDPYCTASDSDNDDETSPLNIDEIYGGSRRSVAPGQKKWDVFRVLPPGNDSGSEASKRFIEITVQFIKVLAYLVTFVVVLGSTILAKGTTLFMTSQLRSNKQLEYCNKNIGIDKQWHVQLPDLERVAWVWAIFFCYLLPELGTLLRSFRICVFKSTRRPVVSHALVVAALESMHSFGLALLVYLVLPELDAIKALLLTNCVCLAPGILGMLSRNSKEHHRPLKTLCDLTAILAQVSGLLLWPLLEYKKGSTHIWWSLPVATVLTSLGWWENYVDKKSSFRFVSYLGAVKNDMKKSRYWTYLFVSLCKIVVFSCTMLLVMSQRLTNVSQLFSEFGNSFRQHTIAINETQAGIPRVTNLNAAEIGGTFLETRSVLSDSAAPIVACLVQVMASYLAYIFGKFACKICIQSFSFAFPVNLTIPVTLSLMFMACGLRSGNACLLRDVLPGYLYFECPKGDYIRDFIVGEYVWVWALWLFSQAWITIHIWRPHCERLASTEKLFVTPMYCSLLIDQSLGMNRRRDDAPERLDDVAAVDMDEADGTQHYETISVDTDASQLANVKASDHVTRIIVCATMWHETRDEMMEMLKSVLRMDEDQSAMRVAQEYLRVRDKDFYEFETHIFFDDAFEMSDEDENEQVANRFVKLMVECIDEAASHVHQIPIRLRPAVKIPTPYGGRLIWTLPGKTKMIVHLKNKMLIRHRKRWSQVMYMYYLLGYRLMELDISVERKETLADNTYLLALDGDIDFQPTAVKLLVDLMKKNRNLGAACGRIHPIGSGPMVWYQMFEYAIGHWLQKATEHMIGCVLCSPGCFSLFRAKALMDDNVMKRYTLTSNQARHYVQYDQGEDRWLCTLLLQRGYRVEYSAASDAYTHCPEGFSEFYNQRRRWVPSTIANIMDLLMDYKNTIKVNDNISLPYIFYQTMLMAGTILGPGTIFLMLVGAFVAAFKIGNWLSFQYNMYPVILFTVVCFTMKSNIQLLVAQILSACYALVIMAVLVGTALQLYEDGPSSPSFIFLMATTVSMVTAAMLHPQELKCLFPGLIYLLAIPSMYLLLILYSIINLNNVTWGTREVLAKKTKKELEEERKAAEEAKKKPGGILGYLHNSKGDDEEGSIEFSFANLFRIMCCTYSKQVNEREQIKRIADSLEVLNKKIDSIDGGGRRRMASRSSTQANDVIVGIPEEDNDTCTDTDTDSTDEVREPRDQLKNPLWIEDKSLKRGKVDYLPPNEIQFWKDLIKQYLWPIDEDKAEKERIARDLAELRNQSVFFFFMCNALFILIVFLMQLNKDNLHIDWPLGVKSNITLIPETGEVIIQKEYLHMEPIGLVFVFFFGLIIVIQFVAMLFHRFGTLSHILAYVDLECCTKNKKESPEEMLRKNAVDIVKNLQRLREDGDLPEESSEDGTNRLARRKTIKNLVNQQQKPQAIGTLDVAFRKRFQRLSTNINEVGTPILGNIRKPSVREDALRVLRQRQTVLQQRRPMKPVETLGATNPIARKMRAARAGSMSTNSPTARNLQDVFNPPGASRNNSTPVSSCLKSTPADGQVKLQLLQPAEQPHADWGISNPAFDVDSEHISSPAVDKSTDQH